VGHPLAEPDQRAIVIGQTGRGDKLGDRSIAESRQYPVTELIRRVCNAWLGSPRGNAALVLRILLLANRGASLM
jgi:hypothetical protein